ncbi:DUF98 domain-containing protein [Actinobacteria bacterium YIM 96077]|uniref:DUF98 domain-containing protein n=1 Tax=Phytoactinopolyspora halophila TaxID=1981511 RepID=A0A329QCV7_9ACTN|nr:chorismate pyruvate-lyase family protein [Phytoactinopolyspora halophila]AYY14164.1 DUF98 domain-containing protein [Actinobacteria bacterium YIM 96077]RAW10243.1 hypothetical protein DPM12_19370 [Phytoactinopolyspora halophila]
MNFSDLAKFFVSQDETDRSLSSLEGLYPAYRAVMVSDGTLTQMLSAMHLEDIDTKCVENGHGFPEPEDCKWLEIDGEPCIRRRVELTGASSGKTYVRALSYLYPPRIPDYFLAELSRAGASLGTQLLQSRISNRRELIWVRTGSEFAFSRLYRIMLHDKPAILVREDFMDNDNT